VLPAASGLATPARADAEKVAHAAWELVEGPRLAGSAVVWREQLCLSACGPDEVACNQVYRYRIRIAPARQRRNLVVGETGCASSGPESFNEDVSFRVSPQHLLVASSSSSSGEFDESAGAGLLGGPIAGPLEQLAACTTEEEVASRTTLAYALDGDLAALDPSPCNEIPELGVRNLADGSTRSIPLEGDREIQHLALSGTLVAAVRAGMVEVYDVRTGGAVYTARLPDDQPFGLQLAADGRVAASFAPGRGYPCGPASVWLAEPELPEGRVLPIRACSEVRFADAGLVYLAANRRHQPESLSYFATEGGGERRIVRFGGILGQAGFDARGELAAYGLLGCSGTVDLYTVAVTGPTEAAGSPRCAARALGRALISYPGGRLRIRLRCPDGCAGRIVARHRGTLLAARPFTLGPRVRAGSVIVRLRRSGRRLLSETRYIALTVEGRITDRAGRTRTIRKRLVPRPVRELPGGRSSESVFLRNPTVTYKGSRAAGVCYEIGYFTSEVDGESSEVFGEGSYLDRCLKRPPLRVPGQGQLAVRTPKEATGVGISPTTGDLRSCKRRRTGTWVCRLPSSEPGRQELNLTVRYPGAESRFKLVLRFT
jgi:hypothetical protein